MKKNIVILGASPKPDRYSNMAQKLLLEKGYTIFPVNPLYKKVDDLDCFQSISEINKDIDTITIYMSPEKTEKIYQEIIAKKPGRVIFNPGTESAEIEKKLEKEGIKVLNACTLVLLKIGQFD